MSMNSSSLPQRPAPARRIALAATVSLGLTAFALGIGGAHAQTTQTLTMGYYTASTGTLFTVSAGVTSLQIEAWGGGAAGGLGASLMYGIGGNGGGGGFAGATFSVTPGQVLTLLVGGGGGLYETGGANGGGSVYNGGGGGGYSAVYNGTSLTTSNLLLVAGGGGGGGYAQSDNSGHAG